MVARILDTTSWNTDMRTLRGYQGFGLTLSIEEKKDVTLYLQDWYTPSIP